MGIIRTLRKLFGLTITTYLTGNKVHIDKCDRKHFVDYSIVSNNGKVLEYGLSKDEGKILFNRYEGL